MMHTKCGIVSKVLNMINSLVDHDKMVARKKCKCLQNA